jgi:hypothetical protein
MDKVIIMDTTATVIKIEAKPKVVTVIPYTSLFYSISAN